MGGTESQPRCTAWEPPWLQHVPRDIRVAEEMLWPCLLKIALPLGAQGVCLARVTQVPVTSQHQLVLSNVQMDALLG